MRWYGRRRVCGERLSIERLRGEKFCAAGDGDSTGCVGRGLQEREGAGGGGGKPASGRRSSAGSISHSAIWVWRVPSYSGRSRCGRKSGAIAGTPVERDVHLGKPAEFAGKRD